MLTQREQIEAEELFHDVRKILKRSFCERDNPEYQRKIAFEEALERHGFRRAQ